MAARAVVAARGYSRWRRPALLGTGYPKGHGVTQKVSISSSSGKPVTVLSNAVASIFWNVITLCDFLWRRVDLNAKVAVIRFDENRLVQYPEGEVLDYRLKSVQPFHATGACALLDISTPVDKQVDWPARQETGYIALQCPDHAHYHVQSENLIVEILDAEGKPCPPGEAGRVVISDWHNLSMSLIRYDICDFVELSEPRRCVRGLPVLKNIMERVCGMLTLADGSRIRPDFGSPHFREVVDICQYQVIQKSREMLEVKLGPGGLSASE